MVPAMRYALISSDLILAVQSGKITNREKEDVLWLLRNNNCRLDSHAIMLTELRNRVIAACPLLQDDAHGVSADVTSEALTFEDQLYPDDRRGDSIDKTHTSYGLSPMTNQELVPKWH
jgi:hypothetical protein